MNILLQALTAEALPLSLEILNCVKRNWKSDHVSSIKTFRVRCPGAPNLFIQKKTISENLFELMMLNV